MSTTQAFDDEEFGDIFDDDEHCVRLTESLDLHDLCDPKGSEFEVDENQPFPGEVPEYNQKDVYKCFQKDVLGAGGEDETTEDGQEKNKDEDDEGSFDIMAKDMFNVMEDGGLKKKILSEGIGNKVPENVEVVVHYNGYLEYCDEPFDSTRLRSKPLKYILGCGEMIPGLEKAIGSMRKGEEANFLISPDWAFGQRGCPPRMPGNATLLFNVELISWVECGDLHKFFTMKIEDRKTCDFRLLRKVTHYFTEEGKQKSNQKKYHPAIRLFSKGIRALEQFHPKDEEMEVDYHKILIRLYKNAAVCALKLQQFGRVIMYANSALEINRNDAKARYLKGKSLMWKGNFDEAKRELVAALAVEPKNKDILKELKALEEKKQRFAQQEISMYRRMFKQPPSDTASNPTDAQTEAKLGEDPFVGDELSTGFKELIHERVQNFVDDHELMELPLTTVNYSSAEINFLKEVIREHHLDFQMKGEGENLHARIMKRSAEIPPP